MSFILRKDHIDTSLDILVWNKFPQTLREKKSSLKKQTKQTFLHFPFFSWCRIKASKKNYNHAFMEYIFRLQKNNFFRQISLQTFLSAVRH